jgi:hypothetical protein
MICAYFYSPEHVTKDFLDLLKKWEYKKTNYNMVHAELHKNKKKNEEDEVQVVTYEGAKEGDNFEHGEGSGKKQEENIRNAPQPPLEFDVSQQKQLLHNAQRELEE